MGRSKKANATHDPRWQEITDLIREHKSMLKAAKTHEELKDFADEQGLMTKQDFGRFKFLLAKIGVRYEELREETWRRRAREAAGKLDECGDDVPLVRLWAASVGDGEDASFAIVDESGEVCWYGAFFDTDAVWVPGDAVSAEQSAASKAVWLAGKAFEAAGVDVGRVEVMTTCPELDSEALRGEGAFHSVVVEVVVDEDDRAVVMAETPGWQSWRECDLAGLVCYPASCGDVGRGEE